MNNRPLVQEVIEPWPLVGIEGGRLGPSLPAVGRLVNPEGTSLDVDDLRTAGGNADPDDRQVTQTGVVGHPSAGHGGADHQEYQKACAATDPDLSMVILQGLLLRSPRR